MKCVASNPIVTANYDGPIAKSGLVWGTIIEGDFTSISGDVSEDEKSVTFDLGESNLDATYFESGGHYYWNFFLFVDNCETSYTWSDEFVQLSYIDYEENTIDLSAFENPDILGPETEICCEYNAG